MHNFMELVVIHCVALEHVRGNIYVKFRLFTNKTYGHDIKNQIRLAVQVDS
jgi:hypothetical protein